MKATYIIVLALILMLCTAGGGFWYWTTTPEYSLGQIGDAVKEHNLSKFQMYFSTDQVAESMVADLLKSPVRKVLGGETLERFLSSGMVSPTAITHEVGGSIAGDIRVLVDTGEFPAQPENNSNVSKVSMDSIDKRIGIRTLSLNKIQSIRVDGNIATVTMLVHSGKFNIDLELMGEMQGRDGYWQATRLVNVAQCFEKLFELEGKTSQ
jgi:hypothetical protein